MKIDVDLTPVDIGFVMDVLGGIYLVLSDRADAARAWHTGSGLVVEMTALELDGLISLARSLQGELRKEHAARLEFALGQMQSNRSLGGKDERDGRGDDGAVGS